MGIPQCGSRGAAVVAAILMILGLGGGVARADPVERPPVEPVVLAGGGCHLVEVDAIGFERFRPGWYLRVVGTKQLANMEVNLQHTPLGGGRWRTEVVGCTPGVIGLPIEAPYSLLLPVSDLPGARAIEIVGANGAWRRRVPR